MAEPKAVREEEDKGSLGQGFSLSLAIIFQNHQTKGKRPWNNNTARNNSRKPERKPKTAQKGQHNGASIEVPQITNTPVTKDEGTVTAVGAGDDQGETPFNSSSQSSPWSPLASSQGGKAFPSLLATHINFLQPSRDSSRPKNSRGKGSSPQGDTETHNRPGRSHS